MIRLSIIYAPDDSRMNKIAELLQKAFDHKQYTIMVKPAAKANMADITSMQAIILGSSGNSAMAIHEDFEEFIRSFSGVNLAGRSAAIFMEEGSPTFFEFAEALKDTDIALFQEPLLIKSVQRDSTNLINWVNKYCSFIKDHDYERKFQS